MQIAKQNGITIKTITSANFSEIDLLQTSNEVKQEIRNAISQGLEVIVPEKDFAYKLWNGITYIIRNPETGEAGYMILSSLAGGKTVEIVFGGGIAGRIALGFLKAWFAWYPGEAISSAYLYFWFFWCALQKKPMIPSDQFLERWLGAALAYEGRTFDTESNREDRKIDCTDLFLWSFSEAFIGYGWDYLSQSNPLWIPDTSADGLAKNKVYTKFDVASWLLFDVLELLPESFPHGFFFPYTINAEGDWLRGDIMSVDTDTPKDGIINHSVIYLGENSSEKPIFYQSSWTAKKVAIFPNSELDPDDTIYEITLDFLEICEHKIWTYPCKR